MQSEIITIICVVTLSIIMVGCIIAIFLYDKTNKKHIISTHQNHGDWLFTNFQETVFNIFFPHPKSNDLCGISQVDYERYCKILHMKPNIKQIVAYRIEALLISLLIGVIAYIVSYNILAFLVCLIFIAATIYIL